MRLIPKILAFIALSLAGNASAATLTEGFEAKTTNGYNDTSVQGNACAWALSNAGVYKSEPNSGTNSLRFGNTATSSATMSTDKSGGAGQIKFYGRTWSAADGTATVAVEYSTDSGSSWKSAGTATLSATTYSLFTYSPAVSGNVRVRLRQTAGKRCIFDDITVTDHTSAAAISSPANNSTVDFGTTTAGTSVQKSINVKGTGLTEACAVSISGTGFSVNATTLSASKVNSTAGATLQVNFKGSNGGTYTGTLTLKTGTTTVKVTLKATVSGSAATTAITSPTNNSTVDFGTTTASKSVVMPVVVKGTGLTSATTVAVSGTGFTANTTSLTAAKVNSAAGATVQLTFKSANGGGYSGKLTLKNGTTTITVNLKATVSAGTSATTATYTSPAAGSTVNFNTVTASKTATSTIVVKGTGLTAATTVTVSGTGFSAGATTLSAAKVNSDAGAQLQINFKASATGSYNGTVRLTSGSLSRTVTLKATIGSSTGTSDDNSGSVTPSVPDSGPGNNPGVSIGNEPSGYYSTCEGKSGKELLAALKTKITSHTSVSYAKLWTSYKTTDTYANGKIWDMYSSRQFTYSTDQCGNYTRIGDCYNREHSFPKSWFKEATPMYTDLFHVIPTDGFVNNQRANYPFGECSAGTYVASNGTVKARGKLGKSTYPGYTGTVWEPDDEYKGDFARAYFYMVTAYNDKVSSWSSPMLAGNAYPAFTTWAMNMLLEWNELDPVSQKEADRQEAVYAIQKNRNPFIDHPELAAYIWGASNSTAWNPQDATTAASISYPTNGSTINFGTVATNATNEKIIQVTGRNVTDNVSVSIDGEGFNASAQWLDASQVNTGSTAAGAPRRTVAATSTAADDAAWLKITFSVAVDSPYEGILTLTTGNVTNKVTLKGRARDGLPAADAERITDTSFDAVWVNVGDATDGKTYRLDVSDSNGPLEGYPVNVDAAALRHTVTGLQPDTRYYYSLTSETMQSNIVETVTAPAVPEVIFTYLTGATDFRCAPGQASDPFEIQLEADNLDGALTLSVTAPFQISENRTDWSLTTTIDPDLTDRIYLRAGATAAGLYHTALRAVAANYYNDALMAHATVASPDQIVEDFEADASGMANYASKTYTGTAAMWNLDDAGMWKSAYDHPRNGDYALRMGNTSASCLTTADELPSIGRIEFHVRKWNDKEANATLAVEYSTDSGASWQTAGNTDITTAEYTACTFTPNVGKPALLRLRQTAGARFFIDDIAVTLPQTSVSAPSAIDTWDAFSPACGQIRIEASENLPYSIYGIDGITYATGNTSGSGDTVTVPGPQLYIVVVNGQSRRVLVK